MNEIVYKISLDNGGMRFKTNSMYAEMYGEEDDLNFVCDREDMFGMMWNLQRKFMRFGCAVYFEAV